MTTPVWLNYDCVKFYFPLQYGELLRNPEIPTYFQQYVYISNR